MSRTCTLFVGTALVMLAAAAWVVWPRPPATLVADSPAGRIEVPADVDLGAVRNGEIVPAAVTLRNPGVTPVTVDEFRTDCACMVVYRVAGQSRQAVGRLVVPAGGSETVYLDLRPSGEPGRPYASSLAFRDSDPEPGWYRTTIRYTPVARVYATPKAVTFGSVPVGSPATQRVELRSDGSYRGDLGGLRCSSPNLYKIAVSMPDPTEQAEFAARFNGQQHLLGFLDVTAHPDKPSTSYDDTLVIYKDNAELLRLEVSGRASAAYTAAPGHLTLPWVEGGKAVYSAAVVLRSRDGQGFQVANRTDDKRFDVTLPTAADGPAVVATVRYTGPPPIGDGGRHTLRFRLTPPGAGEGFDLVVPVTVLPPDGM